MLLYDIKPVRVISLSHLFLSVSQLQRHSHSVCIAWDICDFMIPWFCIHYSAWVGVRSIVINPSCLSVCVCVCVCPLAYLWNRWTDFHKILWADPLWSWLGSPSAALHCVMYFWFYGWRHIFRNEPYGDAWKAYPRPTTGSAIAILGRSLMSMNALLLCPGKDVEYCDQPVSLCVCLSVCEHISGIAGLIFTKFCMQIPCGRGSVLLRWRCAALCTSSFMDDVMFGRNGPYGIAWLVWAASWTSHQLHMRPGRSLMSMNAWLCLVIVLV